MSVLAGDVKPQVRTEGGETIHTYRWPDLEVLVSQGPPKELAKQLSGFEGFVRNALCRGHVPHHVQPVLQQIRDTKLIVGFVASPDMDPQGRAEKILKDLCGALRPLMLYELCIYDASGKLLVGPGGGG